MLNYVIRRLFYMVPIIFCVMVITFFLFFGLVNVETMARTQLPPRASQAAIENWLHQRHYDKPLYLNMPGVQRYQAGQPFYDSLFFANIYDLATFNFGDSLATNRHIVTMFKEGAIPSLLVTAPAFFLSLVLAVSFSLFLVYVRASKLDAVGTIFCVMLMSIPVIVYVIICQWVLGNLLRYFPAYGFSLHGFDAARFLALPIAVLILNELGSDTRLYRAIFLEEVRADYVRTASAKGLSPQVALFKHVLKNGMINIITLTVAALPTLILGTLVLEDFFGIPGLGSLSLTSIRTTDYTVVRAVTYAGSLLYLLGLLLTDICYALVDPRIKLK